MAGMKIRSTPIWTRTHAVMWRKLNNEYYPVQTYNLLVEQVKLGLTYIF